MKKLKSIIAFTLAFILCSCYILNSAAATIWIEFSMPDTDAMFYTDGSNNSHGYVHMSVNGGGEEGETDLRALTHAQNIFFHGNTNVANDIYFIAAEVSVVLTYEDGSVDSLYDWNVAEENYTIPYAVAFTEYIGTTPECYRITDVDSTHKMYKTTMEDGEFIIVEQIGPTLHITSLSS